ncbi:hypothetical protein [Janthinobacterium fluminis]|uniref:O-Antigen ligase n=1 Tax=Janthinobacterium fluminis TaxID=2987524 RepID=A0ABT5JW71_9BURK|nr:hypothetical protein [Janthinobacterium fluminis]MDC8756874.1 hypothetical protein [Janthinobacterium fluminis]
MSGPLVLAGKPLAIACGAAFMYALCFYPLERTWLAPILALYIALLCWRPQLWLFALPALLPALDLAPWTGWFFLEEIDLLLLATVAIGYWRLADQPPLARLPALAAACIAALTLVWLFGMLKAMLPPPAIDVNAFSNYLSPYNSLRVGKSWCWAVLLLPLLTRTAGCGLVNLRRLFLPGMLTGLALVGLAALRERALFPGLLNFSSDYRTTAPFSAMHTGGAALDGYLALSLPFVAAWLLTPQPRPRTAAALALLALGAYAALTTFSRGLFAALACSLLLLVLFPLRLALRSPAAERRSVLAGALLALLGAAALARMFAGSGYRGMAAAAVLLAAAAMLATLPLPRRLLPASFVCASAAAALLGAALTAAGLPERGMLAPPYLLFLLAALTFGAAFLRLRLAPTQEQDVASVALIAFTCLLYATVWIAWHWAGRAALAPAALVAALAVLPIAINARLRRPLWRLQGGGAIAAAGAAVLLLLAIPVSASYYAGERFATTAGDLRHRLRHWQQALAMMDDDGATRAFGMGLGTFPVNYFWRHPQGELPATLEYADEPGNRFVRLGTGQYTLGYGEVLRLLQRVEPRPRTRYVFALDVRRRGPMPVLQAALCERLLLYQQNCVSAPLRLPPGGAGWRHYRMVLDSATLGRGAWALRAPVQLEIAAAGPHGSVDIDNLSLRDEADNGELLRNGGFSDANNYWFFSSDRQHLPWHIKNFALNLYFELGWAGLLAMLSLLACALGQLARPAWRGDAAAPVYMAALAGFLVVGLFDSLLDVPRVSLLFFLVLYCSIAQPAGGAPPPKGVAP